MTSTQRLATLVFGLLIVAMSIGGAAQTPQTSTHHVVSGEAISWKALRPGVEIAVISGNPDKEGSSFVLRFRYRGKARIPPHWHPVDEHITVLSGTFRMGMGEHGDESAVTALTAGAYAFVPARMAHFAWTDDDTTVQVHGVGPFVINYVNPADDPKNATRK
jgi:quercetin dioxygenase-like cupin family protein